MLSIVVEMCYSDSDGFIALLLKESHILFNSWLVHLMADHLEKFSEGLLISLTGLPLSELKIDFSQVHSDRSWRESFEKLGDEL